MKELVTLYNVIDTRTEQFHSVAIVEKKKAKYFVPYVEESDE